jgi:hypothetical protein
MVRRLMMPPQWMDVLAGVDFMVDREKVAWNVDSRGSMGRDWSFALPQTHLVKFQYEQVF